MAGTLFRKGKKAIFCACFGIVFSKCLKRIEISSIIKLLLPSLNRLGGGFGIRKSQIQVMRYLFDDGAA